MISQRTTLADQCLFFLHLSFTCRAMAQSVVLEKYADGLSVVHTADGLGKDGGDVENLELGALAAVLLLRDRVGDDDLVNGRGVDARNRVAAEDTVGDKGVDFCGSLALEQLGGARDGVGRVDQVVYENADAVGHVADEHHAGVALLGELDRTAFL